MDENSKSRNPYIQLQEKAAKLTLKFVRSQGHPYFEIREKGKYRFMLFCVLCHKPCYGDSSVFDHLNGKFHKRRLPYAKLTLMKENPWPFNDGFIFFDTSTENVKELKEVETTNTKFNRSRLLKLLESDNDIDNSLAMVKFGDEAQSEVLPIGSNNEDGSKLLKNDNSLATDDTLDDGSTLVIPGLRVGDETIDVKVRKVGLGKISARFVDYYYGSSNGNEIRRIWCEWLGKENSQQDDIEVQEHDFAVVVFPYSYDLGRKGVLDSTNSLLPSASTVEPENGRESGRKKKTHSSAEDSPSLKSYSSTSTLDQSNTQVLRTKFVSNKAIRKAMRRRERLAAEKVCSICHHNMIPGKDVAAFLNLKTGKIACCSRNPIGAFHLFHTASVINWILLCEYEIITNCLVHQNGSRDGKKKIVTSSGREDKDIKHVFCPECEGAGLIIADGLEHPKFCSPSQISRLKSKTIVQHNEWIKCPEDLQNCSIGFYFPSQTEGKTEERVEPLKMLHFYRADDPCVGIKNCANVA